MRNGIPPLIPTWTIFALHADLKPYRGQFKVSGEIIFEMRLDRADRRARLR